MSLNNPIYRIPLTEDFDIRDSLYCGQCFRFEELTDTTFRMIAKDRVLNISIENQHLHFYPCTDEEFLMVWTPYFSLDRNYRKMKNVLKQDPILKKAISFAPGIRIFKQDPFETLISFIISQNKNITHIKKIVHQIACTHGHRIENDPQQTAFAFPKPEDLFSLSLEDWKQMKTGFRAKYCFDAVSKIQSGEIQLEQIETMAYTDALEYLKTIKGVGDKVANCVLLFAYGKTEAFPIDIWVERMMRNYYFKDQAVTKKEIQTYANNNFGQFSGYAQQYLFYYAKENKFK